MTHLLCEWEPCPLPARCRESILEDGVLESLGPNQGRLAWVGTQRSVVGSRAPLRGHGAVERKCMQKRRQQVWRALCHHWPPSLLSLCPSRFPPRVEGLLDAFPLGPAHTQRFAASGLPGPSRGLPEALSPLLPVLMLPSAWKKEGACSPFHKWGNRERKRLAQSPHQ